MNNSKQRSAFVQRGIRLALIFGLAWLGVNTATSIRTLLAPPPASRNELPAIVDNVNLLSAEGSWRFDDSQAMIATSLADNLKLPTANHTDRNISIDEPTLKAFVEMDENSDVSAATFAMQVDDKWQVLKLGSTQSQQATTHLLPLKESKRVCGRWSEDDRLLLEIVSVNTNRRELLDAWRTAGWQLRHTAWGGLDSFSFLCVKDDRIVYAWSQQPQQIKSLLLSSSPDVILRQTTSNNGETS